MRILFPIVKQLLGNVFVAKDPDGKPLGFKPMPIAIIALCIAFVVYLIKVDDVVKIDEAFELIVSAIISVAAPAGVSLYNNYTKSRQRKRESKTREK